MRMNENKYFKTAILTIVSVFGIVLFWFVLNYLCEKCSNTFSWVDGIEIIRPIIFFVVYFILEWINYKFYKAEYGLYVLLQGFLDFVVFVLAIDYLGGIVKFIPVNTPKDNYAEVRTLILFIQDYLVAFFLSNIIMLMIWKRDKNSFS